MSRATRISIVLAILIVLIGSTSFAYRAGWLVETADQKKVTELKTQLATTLHDQKSFSPRPQFFESLKQQVSSLPAQYQQQFRESARNIFMHEMEQRMDNYMKMSKLERRAELDRNIAEMEQMRKQFASRRQQSQAGGANGPGATATDAPPAGEARRGGPGGGRGISAMLDHTSPEFRAKMGIYMHDMQQRRKELGLPTGGPFGR